GAQSLDCADRVRQGALTGRKNESTESTESTWSGRGSGMAPPETRVDRVDIGGATPGGVAGVRLSKTLRPARGRRADQYEPVRPSGGKIASRNRQAVETTAVHRGCRTGIPGIPGKARRV